MECTNTQNKDSDCEATSVNACPDEISTRYYFTVFEILLIFIPSFLFEENAFSNAVFKTYVNSVPNFSILIWWEFVARFCLIILRFYQPNFLF